MTDADDDLWAGRCKLSRNALMHLSRRLVDDYGPYPVIVAMLAAAAETAKDNDVDPAWLDKMLTVVAKRKPR